MRGAVAAAAALVALLIGFTAVIGAVLGSLFTGPTPTAPSPAAAVDIPANYLRLYTTAAATCPGLDWSILAAVGAVESDHGRSRLPGVHTGSNGSGAQGPMQFLPATFAAVVAAHPPPPGGATPPSPYVPHDAVHAAAAYLCDNGARDGRDLRAALFTYNPSSAYVDDVLSRANAYRATTDRTRASADDANRPATPPGSIVTQWPPEQATIPDPSGTGGRVTPRLDTLYRALADRGAITGGATCAGTREHNPNSDHPAGRACDLMFNPHDPAQVARGWDIAHWLTLQQAAYGIRYLIWQGQIWTASNPAWNTYGSSNYGCPNPKNLTGCHYDHIHISMY